MTPEELDRIEGLEADLRARAMDATCCAGLKYPALPYLHAEDCLRRQDDPCFYREDFNERRQFDRDTDLFGGDPLNQVASTLDSYGRASPYQGSYARSLFVLANEVLIARAHRDALLAEARRAKELEGALREIVERLQDAKSRCNSVAAARRKIGPIATQAQTAAHSIASALSIIDERLSSTGVRG